MESGVEANDAMKMRERERERERDRIEVPTGQNSYLGRNSTHLLRGVHYIKHTRCIEFRNIDVVFTYSWNGLE